MRHIGIREFKNQATAMLNAGETLVIERHGQPVGFYVPVKAKDRAAGRAAMAEFGRAVEELLDELGIDEDQLVREIVWTKHPRR